ncbi:hypothetical protein DL98DRAFT_186639 [Cadophora sp. DSE1049]|nr:hypothetical protein DL98DRAFT_186639 [Cadophora sp. DSE1049]
MVVAVSQASIQASSPIPVPHPTSALAISMRASCRLPFHRLSWNWKKIKSQHQSVLPVQNPAADLQPGQKLAFASLRSSSLASFSFLKIQNTTATTATKPMTVTRIEAIVRADQSLPGFAFVYGELVRGVVDAASKTTTVAVGDGDIMSFGIWFQFEKGASRELLI